MILYSSTKGKFYPAKKVKSEKNSTRTMTETFYSSSNIRGKLVGMYYRSTNVKYPMSDLIFQHTHKPLALLAETKKCWNLLFPFCFVIGQLCLGDPGFCSLTVNIHIHTDISLLTGHYFKP